MSNPVLNNEAAEKFRQEENSFEVMSISGVITKTLFLFAVLFCTAFFGFTTLLKGFSDKADLLMNIGIFGGLITALVIIFSKSMKLIAPLSILYSALEGLAIGVISCIYTAKFGNMIVLNAVCATFITFLTMLFLYATKIIKCSEKFRSTVIAATFAIFVIYLVTFIVSLINPQAGSILMGNGLIGIGFSVIVCIVAALNFIIDFHTIDNAKNMNLTKNFEWYCGFSLMVTFIWMYLEILRLLGKLNSKN